MIYVKNGFGKKWCRHCHFNTFILVPTNLNYVLIAEFKVVEITVCECFLILHSCLDIKTQSSS